VTQQFSAEIVAQLLHALFKSRMPAPGMLTVDLCKLPAALQLSSSVVEQLLLAAADLNSSYYCRDTCIIALRGLLRGNCLQLVRWGCKCAG
jgi:hypothetical protein